MTAATEKHPSVLEISEEEKKHKSGRKRSCPLAAVVAVATFVAVILALGLGLGLGLRKHGGKPVLSGTTPANTPASNPTSALPSWRRDPSEYTLNMNWDINVPPTTRIFNLTISEIQAAPDGVLRPILVINGQFPGPLIRVNEGDRVLVNVTNQLSNATTLHWHGLYQNGTNWMDGTTGVTQCPIPPGKSFLYNFTVENQFGTYWYHSHYGTQYVDGLVGPFIVHSPAETDVRKSYDYDQIILLQDWYHDLSPGLLEDYLSSGNENAEPIPDNGLIQGTNFFNCSSLNEDSGYTCQDNSTQAALGVTPNKRYRLRIINTGAFAEFQFSIDNHTLSVIEADSTLISPLTVHRLPIHIAQRYSVIITTNQSVENYWIRAQMNTDCFSADNPILNPDVRALLSYTNTTTAPARSIDWADALALTCEDLSMSSLVPSVIEASPSPDHAYVIDISFQIGAYALDRAYVNSTSWTPTKIPTLNQAVAGLHTNNNTFATAGISTAYDTSQFVIDVPNYAVIDLLINSLDEGAHPFHLHGHQFWLMATGSSGAFNWKTYDSLNTTNPMRRDTFTIDAFGWALIRFRADNPGLWAFHCHVAWHMEAGLLMQFQTRNDIMSGWTLPSDVLELCES